MALDAEMIAHASYTIFAADKRATVGPVELLLPAMLDALWRLVLPAGEGRREFCAAAVALATEAYYAFLREAVGDNCEGCSGGAPDGAGSVVEDDLERRLLLVLMIAAMLGDEPMLKVGQAFFRIGKSDEHLASMTACLRSGEIMDAARKKHDPGQFLRRVVRDRLQSEGRVRPQQGRGQKLLSLDHAGMEVAHLGTAPVVDASADALRYVLQALRASPSERDARLADVIERSLAGDGKQELGRADYQSVYDARQRLRPLLLQAGVKPPAGRCSSDDTARTDAKPARKRTECKAASTWVYETPRITSVAHRYRDEELEAYGQQMIRSLPIRQS